MTSDCVADGTLGKFDPANTGVTTEDLFLTSLKSAQFNSHLVTYVCENKWVVFRVNVHVQSGLSQYVIACHIGCLIV